MTDVRRITCAWALLSVITIGTWCLGHESDAPSQSTRTLVAIAALVIATVKVALIIGQFMEVRRAPRWLRVATTAWLVTLVGVILAVYLQ